MSHAPIDIAPRAAAVDQPIESKTQSDDRRTWLILSTGLAAVAAWLSLTHLQSLQDADSMVPVLTSLYDWSPFYWEQDRYGMLLPLMAMPIRHPLGNLLAQAFLMSYCGLLCFFLGSRFLVGRGRWLYPGLLATALVLLLPTRVVFGWLMVQPYGFALTLSFLGLLCLERHERATAVWYVLGSVLLLGGAYVVSTCVFPLVPLVVLREGLRGGRRTDVLRRIARLSVPIAASFVLASLFSAMSVFAGATDKGLVPASQWPHAWKSLSASLARNVRWEAIVLFLGVALLGLIIRVRQRRPLGLAEWTPPLGAGAIYALLVGTTVWVGLNAYEARYVLPCLALGALAVGIIAVGWVRDPRPSGSTCLAVLMLVCIVGTRFGLPSYAGVRDDLDAKFGRYSQELEANAATHVLGDYWTVWPTVFHVNWMRHERGERENFWAISYRSQASRDRWMRLPQDQLVIALLRSDAETATYQSLIGYPAFEPIGSSERFDYGRPPQGFSFP